MAEGDTFAIGALVRKRAELAGLVERHRAELAAMLANLGHLDATLRLFDPEIRLDAIRPKAPRAAAEPGRPAITTRMVLDALRRAGEPLGAREIAARVLAGMGADAGDTKLVRDTVESSGRALRRQRAKGTVACRMGPDGCRLWALSENGQ
jgi:hypothetical protein